MKNKYERNKFGEIYLVKNSKPKSLHKNTQDEYELLIKEQKDTLFNVKETIIKNINQLQSRMVKINCR